MDGNPAHLKPAREAALARELTNLAGGVTALAARAREVAADGEYALACELIEFAALAAPADPTIHTVRTEIYGERAKREQSLMARGVFAAAADASRRNS